MHVALASAESFYDNALALDYIARYAEARPSLSGATFQIEVQNGEAGNGDFLSRILQHDPQVVGFNTYVWNVELSIKLAREIKRKRPQSVVVFGGMEATFSAERLMAEVPEVDFIIVGEGEIPFADLLQRLLGGTALQGAIPGLAYRDAGGQAIMGGLGPVIQNLDEIPSPFAAISQGSAPLKRVLYESYRGCAFHCAFCLYQRSYASQRYFSMERVKSDISAILASGATHLRFVDSTFNLHRARTKEILHFLSGCQAEVLVEVSAEFFDQEMISLLPAAGIKHIDIGLQSTQVSALKAINREWYRQERFNENLQHLRDDPRLTLNVELIAGLPGDDWDGLRKSIDDAVIVWPDHVSIYRLLGLHGTPLDRDRKALGLSFSETPPYELIESAQFSPETLLKVDELTFAHMLLFNLGIARFALKHAMRAGDLRPTEIYGRFLDFVFKEKLYSVDAARHLGRFHGYGNRFDQPMPDGFEPLRVRATVDRFFSESGLWSGNPSMAALSLSLIDFGFELAMLDRVKSNPPAFDPGPLGQRRRLAPWCRIKDYPAQALDELVHQGNELGDLPPDQIAAVVFVIHPELGPAALAVDRAVADLLGSSVTPDRCPDSVANDLERAGVLVGGSERGPNQPTINS